MHATDKPAKDGVDQRNEIQTPRSRPSLLLRPTLPRLAAWVGVRFFSKPMRFGKTVIAARHSDVSEVLRRDLDFSIGPINAERIEAVNGPFVLGMDRGDRLAIERRALYSALSAIDLGGLQVRIAAEADRLLAAAPERSIDAVGAYARIVAGHTANWLFGVSGPDNNSFLDVARAIFAHTFLNLGDDKQIETRALKAAALMRSWLEEEIRRRRQSGDLGADFMAALLRQAALDDDGVRRILGGMLVGSIDTTATCVAKILAVLGQDRRLGEAARVDARDLKLTAGWCREALRRWPHNPAIVRHAAANTTLNGVAVPAGSRIFAWTQAAMQDATAFPEPHQMRPDRPAGNYLHFGGGLHPCAGRSINDLQIPILVSKLLIRGVVKVGKIGWAGPFPHHLDVTLGS